tara:strand:+ start:2239 stop:2937 length:699 start_codon:yes stop_codon:yes gene_type:complete
MNRILTLALCCVPIAGCATTPGLDPQGAVATSYTSLPAPTIADRYGNSPIYTVGPFDVLDLTVFDLPELDLDLVVDANGDIAIPLVGTVNTTGMTRGAVEDEIRARLRRYVTDPQVALNIKEATSRTVTVDGQVRNPGVFQVRSNLTLMRAIATANGTTNDANLQQVAIFRTVDNQRLAALYDLGAIRRGTYEDPAVYPDDVIVVGDTPRTRFFRDLGPILTTPLILLLQTL